MHVSKEMRCRALWAACTPLLPLAALQGAWVMRRIIRLPEARGATSGFAGADANARTVSFLIVGESTAAGVGVDSHAEGIGGHLAAIAASRLGCRVRWDAMGRDGATAAGVRRRLQRGGVPEADVAVVLLGVNDTMRLTPVREWERSIAGLMVDLRATGARYIVFSALAPVHRFPSLPVLLRSVMGARAKLLDATLERIATSGEGTRYAPVRFADDPSYVAADGFHPSSRGYSEWARNLAEEVAPLVELLGVPRTALRTEGLADASRSRRLGSILEGSP